MTLEQFFDKYPDAWISAYRIGREWYFVLFHDDSDADPIITVVGKSPQVALGNLAAKLIHMKPEDLPATQESA